MSVVDEKKIVSRDVIERDKKLVTLVAEGQRQLDQLRWENTECVNGPQHTVEAYAEAVGRRADAIRESVSAWGAHGKGCTDPSHQNHKILKPEDMPTEDAHTVGRLRARHGAKRASVTEALSKRTGLTPATVDRNRPREIEAVLGAADEIAAKAGREVDEVIIEAAADKVMADAGADKARRTKVKDTLTDIRRILGSVDDVTDSDVEDIIRHAEKDLALKLAQGKDVTLDEILDKQLDLMLEGAKKTNLDWVAEKKRKKAVYSAMVSGGAAISAIGNFWGYLDLMEEDVALAKISKKEMRAFQATVIKMQCWINALNKRLAGDPTASFEAELAEFERRARAERKALTGSEEDPYWDELEADEEFERMMATEFGTGA